MSRSFGCAKRLDETMVLPASSSSSSPPPSEPPLVLIIDNFDSYTFNLYQLISTSKTYPCRVLVIRNNTFTWPQLLASVLPHVSAIVISPGPGRPDCLKDFGVCGDLLRSTEHNIPALGVCLGHQGIAFVHGAQIIHAPEPYHGRSSPVTHKLDTSNLSTELLRGIPTPFEVIRYHSLIVSGEGLPECIEPIAWTGDIIMALKHRFRPQWGVQFHPESISTSYGRELVDNFLRLALLERQATHPLPADVMPLETLMAHSVMPSAAPKRPVAFRWRKISRKFNFTTVYDHLYKHEKHSFWLDSSKSGTAQSRFSYMGAQSGSMSYSAFYFQEAGAMRVTGFGGGNYENSRFSHGADDPWDWLDAELKRVAQSVAFSENLPFDFYGGFVGYFAYELKNLALDLPCQVASRTKYPGAAFVFVQQFLVYDHDANDMYICGLCRTPEDERWLDATQLKLGSITCDQAAIFPTEVALNSEAALRAGHEKSAYLKNIRAAQKLIKDGESYEVCLTTSVSGTIARASPTASFQSEVARFYYDLRLRNPAPFGVLFQFEWNPATIEVDSKSQSCRFALAGSSPEKFMSITKQGNVCMKPIKGTVARALASAVEDRRRAEALENDVKERSENLMIVDLIRNDLNMVCEPASVQVPKLLHVESYATVHQLVSTITGTLRADLSPPHAIKHCFPPGSMTGAPKRRTVEILEQLEAAPRGPYSGVFGYFSLTGSADFSVVIRTAFFSECDDDGEMEVSLGTGGAITSLSNPDQEYEEMLLKTQSIVPSLQAVFGMRYDPA